MDAREPSLLTATPQPAGPAIASPRGPSGPSAPSAPAAREPAATSVTVSGFWRRAAAAVVDSGITLPAALLLAIVVCRLLGLALPAWRALAPDRLLDLAVGGDPALWTVLILLLVVRVLYDGLYLAFAARTPGMRLLGLRLIDAFGEPPRVPRVLVRLAAKVAGLATLGLGALWAGVDAEKRMLHDHLAGTYVIRDEAAR